MSFFLRQVSQRPAISAASENSFCKRSLSINFVKNESIASAKSLGFSIYLILLSVFVIKDP